jgi:hypothetical protein
MMIVPYNTSGDDPGFCQAIPVAVIHLFRSAFRMKRSIFYLGDLF